MKHPHAKKVRFNIELKSVPAKPEWSAPAEQYAKLLVLELKTAKLEHRVTVQSFDHRLLREVKRIAPQLPVAALTGEVYPNYVALMEELGAEILSPNMAWIDRDAVSALHAANKRVIPWTANSAAEWDALIAMGVDGIITDDPHALMLHLQKRGKRPYP
jgi:glycerophosphoryl diester phosphodiesterase